MHEHPPDLGHPEAAAHLHGHPEESLDRTPREAFGVGLVHGVGGSAGVGVLLMAAASTPAVGTFALFAFGAGTRPVDGSPVGPRRNGLATGAIGR